MAESSAIDINKIIASTIQNNFEVICKKLTGSAKLKFQKLQIDFNHGFTKYLERALEKYSKIKTIIYRSEPKYLYDFFECNTLSFKKKRIDASDVNKILDVSHFLLVSGTGGIGKSTLMKHFFLNELYKNDLIPVFVELKDMNEYEGDIVDFIYYSMNKLGFILQKEAFKYALSGGSFLFLFDGYDEVNMNKSSTLFSQIKDMCDRYYENFYIVSTRPIESFVKFQRFSVLEIEPLSKKQAINLVRKIDFDEDIKTKFLKNLEASLYDKHKSFASNPLLLNIMLLTYDNYAEIPEKLHLFYSNAFETLYQKHDATKAGYKREMRSKASYNTFKDIFSKLCFRTYIQRMASFTSDELYENVKNVIKDYPNLNTEDYIYDLQHAVCVIQQDGLQYKFTHRSFQEYFTASYIKELDDQQQQQVCFFILSDRGRYHQADEIFNMLSDMAEERYEKNVLIPLLEDIEAKLSPQQNKYHAYIKALGLGLVLSIGDGNNKRKSERGRISLLLTVKNTSIIFSYIFKHFRDEIGIIAQILSNEDTLRLENLRYDLDRQEDLDVITSKDNQYMFFDSEEILDNEWLSDILQDSFIGRIVNKACSLKDYINCKHDIIMRNLNDILNI